MNYVVNGADRASGKEMTLTFQASNPAEAEAFATLSMFVSEVREERPAVGPVAYATPAAAKDKSEVNWAAGIVFHARLLRILGILVALMAIYPLGEYGWVVLLALWNLFVERTAQSAFSLAQSAAISPNLTIGVVLIALAILMRLASYVALAINEIVGKS